MSLIVTGSSGFIGSNLCNLLEKKNIKFIGIDKKKNPYLKVKNFYKVNLKNINKIEKIIKSNKIKYLIHLAAIPGFVKCHNDPQKAFEENIKVTFNLLLLAKKYNFKKVIFASSFSVDKFLENPSIYGFTKFTCENICRTFIKNYNLNISIAKISNAFGLYSLHKESVVHSFLKNSINKKKLQIHNTGKQKRDFVFATTVVEKIYKALKLKKFIDTINISTNRFVSVLEIKNMIDKISEKRNKFQFVKTPAGYDDKVYNIKNNRSNLLLKSNLKKTHKWYMKYYN